MKTTTTRERERERVRPSVTAAKTEKFLLLCEVEGLENIELRRAVPKNSEEEEEDCRRGRIPRMRAGERGILGLL